MCKWIMLHRSKCCSLIGCFVFKLRPLYFSVEFWNGEKEKEFEILKNNTSPESENLSNIHENVEPT